MKKSPTKPNDLLAGMQAIYSTQAQHCLTRWRRLLPFSDMVVDRWEKARLLKTGPGSSLYDSAHVYGDVTIGKNTWVGPFVILDGSGDSVRIGDNCSIAAGVQIYSHDSVAWAVSGGKTPYAHAPVNIGNCCYIGPYAVVTGGVSIGAHSIVGAFSLVTHDVPSHTFVHGIPARPAGTITIAASGSIRIRPLGKQPTRQRSAKKGQ